MKLPRPHPNLALLFLALALCSGLARAQTPAPSPIAENLDVFFGETKFLSIDRPVDDFSISPDDIVKVDKVDSSPNQLSLVGLTGGTAMLTVKSAGRTLLYAVTVSTPPERIYINLNESKRLSFPDPIDDTSLSQQGIVHVVQPDSTDRVLLVEANTPGKTTLTVFSKGQIYRYFISTFENRGADVLEIENAFSAKGYRNLTITFDKDQAILGGTVPTQEELDDAVRIVKQYTDFVVVKANLGQDIEQSEFSEEEAIIINNIQRIANVQGLTVRVKFPAPTVVTTSTYTNSAGDYIAPEVTTTPQGGTIRGTGFNPPADPNQAGPNGAGPLEPKPQVNTTETTTTTKNTSIPEKIFLYGDLEDDLEEARVIRVARTFCPFIVSFLTVKDPIQLRTQIRFVQLDDTKTRNVGFDWSNGSTGPTITLGFGGPGQASTQPLFNNLAGSISNSFINYFTHGISGSVDAQAVFNLYQTLGVSKLLRETELFLTNGQPGWYSEGEVQSYVSSSVTTASSPPLTTLTASAIFLGVNLDISPLNLVKAGGVEPTGQKIYGVPSSVGTGSNGYTLEEDSDPTADKVSQVARPIQAAGAAPLVDNTVKYVDENGLIGLNISTQMTLPNGPINSPANRVFLGAASGSNSDYITLPDFFVRSTRTRVNLRDGQTVAINGLIDQETIKNITGLPFLTKIPIFGALFRDTSDSSTRGEVVVLVTPHIVRMRDDDRARYPKPVYPEMQDLSREYGDVPIIKPVRYDAQSVDLRPASSPKDMKEASTESASSPENAPISESTPPAEPEPLTSRPGTEPEPAPIEPSMGTAHSPASIRPEDTTPVIPPAPAASLAPPSTLP
jgi:Flp pilus assembly secretin CpaC